MRSYMVVLIPNQISGKSSYSKVFENKTENGHFDVLDVVANMVQLASRTFFVWVGVRYRGRTIFSKYLINDFERVLEVLLDEIYRI